MTGNWSEFPLTSRVTGQSWLSGSCPNTNRPAPEERRDESRRGRHECPRHPRKCKRRPKTVLARVQAIRSAGDPNLRAGSTRDWVHNRFRDLEERWKSASTGRRNRLPHLLAKRLIQQGGAGGFACRSNGHNQQHPLYDCTDAPVWYTQTKDPFWDHDQCHFTNTNAIPAATCLK